MSSAAYILLGLNILSFYIYGWDKWLVKGKQFLPSYSCK